MLSNGFTRPFSERGGDLIFASALEDDALVDYGHLVCIYEQHSCRIGFFAAGIRILKREVNRRIQNHSRTFYEVKPKGIGSKFDPCGTSENASVTKCHLVAHY